MPGNSENTPASMSSSITGSLGDTLSTQPLPSPRCVAASAHGPIDQTLRS
jgi:hypothetical protein